MHKELVERLTDSKKNRIDDAKSRERWSRSVLEMHKKQRDQVERRHMSLSETMKVKKTYDSLRREDQHLNYQDIISDFREDL